MHLMDNPQRGLWPKFKLNRPLTPREKELHLPIDQSAHPYANHNFGVIQMNSTFLDTVNKHYAEKGHWTMVAWLTCMPPCLLLLITSLYLFIDDTTIIYEFLFAMCISWLIGYYGVWNTSYKDCFSWTHYPVRFNRQNRMVYFTRYDGTVGEAKWDEIFFCLKSARLGGVYHKEIRGHVLADDRDTVLETFTLAALDENIEWVVPHWEFVRRYMQNGPEQFYRDPNQEYDEFALATGILGFCNDVDEKRESPEFGLARLNLNYYRRSRIMSRHIAIPFWRGTRAFAMKHSKVPTWPEHVKATSKIAEDDPFVVTAKDNVHFPIMDEID